jgi:hypothetical protein
MKLARIYGIFLGMNRNVVSQNKQSTTVTYIRKGLSPSSVRSAGKAPDKTDSPRIRTPSYRIILSESVHTQIRIICTNYVEDKGKWGMISGS